MTVQAVLFGPLLGLRVPALQLPVARGGAARPARGARRRACSSRSAATRRSSTGLDPASGLPLNAVLHVPFHVISLGDLAEPRLGAAAAHAEPQLPRLPRLQPDAGASARGCCSALLFHSHTLTFVNVAAAQLAYLVLANALERPRDRRFKAWLAGARRCVAARFVALVAIAADALLRRRSSRSARSRSPRRSCVDPNKRFYLWSYGAAALLALPYVLLLAPTPRARSPRCRAAGTRCR